MTKHDWQSVGIEDERLRRTDTEPRPPEKPNDCKDQIASANPLLRHYREEISGRFNEFYILRRYWPLVMASLQGSVLPPFEVIIHPTSTCNLHCAWCIGDHLPVENPANTTSPPPRRSTTGRLPDSLADPDAMRRVVEGIVQYRKTLISRQDGREHVEDFRVQNVTFSGLIGEPLIANKAVLKAMDFLVESGLRVGMFTNGVLMDEATWDVILRTAFLHMSLDASNAVTYSRLKYGDAGSGETQFHRALQNLKGLISKRGAKSMSNLRINASFVVNPQNHTELFDAAFMLKDLGIDALRIKQDIAGRRLLNDLQKKRALALIERIKQELVDSEFGLVVLHKLDDPEEMVRSHTTCHMSDIMAAIGSDGRVYPCNYHPRPDGASYGSAIDVPFGELWEGRDRMDTRRCLPSICPARCDPYKNRANRLLATAYRIYATQGSDKLEAYRQAALAEIGPDSLV